MLVAVSVELHYQTRVSLSAQQQLYLNMIITQNVHDHQISLTTAYPLSRTVSAPCSHTTTWIKHTSHGPTV